MESKINVFYKNKTIFITGGTGFLGTTIIEKLLRTTEVKRIYMLVRPKHGVEIQSRIAALKDNFLFSVLLKSNANFLDRVVAISGDCEKPDLGISEADRQRLVEEVQVVIHSAATVNFVEALGVALSINTRATRLVLQLAKQMLLLEACVHVSTAFSNCMLRHIKETYYPQLLTCSADKVLALRELLGNELIDSMTPALLGQFPNTYTYTKALSEQVVQLEAGDLPVCVFRPGMIIPICKEPVQGWIDNLYGPISAIYACALGVLRVTILDPKVRSNSVPVDYCANLVLCSAWKTALDEAQRKERSITGLLAPAPTVYNFVPTEQNPLKWSDFLGGVEKLRSNYPFKQMIWFPYLLTVTTIWGYNLLSIIYHHIPGAIIDIGLRVRGQKPRMRKIYQKIHTNMRNLAPFGVVDWTYETRNTDLLKQRMPQQDRILFEFDLNSINWNDYWNVAASGIREFLGKELLKRGSLFTNQGVSEFLGRENKKALASPKELLKRFYIYNLLAHFFGGSVLAAIIFSLLNYLL